MHYLDYITIGIALALAVSLIAAYAFGSLPDSVQHSKFACVKCNALFPAGEGQVSLEYILLDGDANE